MAKITVIIPVYQVEQYLKRCVDSILTQTFTDFEMILVDDGSPDNCGNICDEYAKKDMRVRVIHKENGGLSSARNAGMAVATGEYLMFVDSDDYIHPQTMEILLYGIIKENADMAMGRLFYTDKDSQKCDVLNKEDYRILDKEAFWNMGYEGKDAFCQRAMCPAKLYRMKCIKEIRFHLDRKYEDVFWLSDTVGNLKKIVAYPYDIYYYYQHPGSIMHEKITYNSMKDAIDGRLYQFHACSRLFPQFISQEEEVFQRQHFKDLYRVLCLPKAEAKSILSLFIKDKARHKKCMPAKLPLGKRLVFGMLGILPYTLLIKLADYEFNLFNYVSTVILNRCKGWKK